MARLQINPDASIVERDTSLWPSTKDEQTKVLHGFFGQNNWSVVSLENINGSHWKVITKCQDKELKINLYVGSIRDESRVAGEYKMQLGNYYPKADEPGWLTLVMGVYTINDGINPQEYILAGYRDIKKYNFSGNPSLRGTRIEGLQNAKIYGFYETDLTFIFRPEFLYYYINKINKQSVDSNYAKVETDAKWEQTIFFGAPGTGKSFKVEHRDGETEDDRIRTTFHPDTDYSSFVGCYKPIEVGDGEDKRITYKFEGQCFAKAYLESWRRFVNRYADQNINYTLIIEEINRGNCAQIFGDVFQLLDRDKNGFSQYGIVPDEDLAKYLREEFDDIKEQLKGIGYPKIALGEEMKLPPNLSIVATMNTSDQSLFPIDSAFKRRWDWEYIPIQYSPIDKETEQSIANKININGTIYDWGSFIKKVNERIYKLTKSEDKELGYFFVRPDEGINITMKRFVSKVIFYLWSDIYKDYAGRDNSIFKFSEDDDEKNKIEHSFNSFFDEEKIKDWLVKKFIEQFVKPVDEEENTSDNKLKYSINGEDPISGRRIALEVMKKYVNIFNQQTPQQVVDEWNTLGIKVTHFVETEDEYNSRTDQSLRVQSVEWGDGNKVYVTTHGWVYNTNDQYKVSTIKQLIEAVNAKNWGIKVDIIEQ